MSTETIFTRLAKAIEVMETSCATRGQKYQFLHAVTSRYAAVGTDRVNDANKIIADEARAVARIDQRADLERLLKEHGFIPKNTKHRVTLQLDIDVEGGPEIGPLSELGRSFIREFQKVEGSTINGFKVVEVRDGRRGFNNEDIQVWVASEVVE